MNIQSEQNISVAVKTRYEEAQSLPASDRYVFSYTITLHNKGTQAAKLLNRHWLITDGNGKQQEVRGEGVVGEQPLLQPDETYQYTSGTVLDTPIGSMQGDYEMIDEQGGRFMALIAPFSLAVPHLIH